MSEKISDFLKLRGGKAYRSLLNEIEGVDAEQALAGRRSHWTSHRWGVGQNGSIAGIVYHVAAWKGITLGMFNPELKTLQTVAFDASSAPAPDNWEGIVVWLKTVGGQWTEALQNLPGAEFDREKIWEGSSLTVAEFIAEMYEHDVQHASQIEYLRQAMKVDNG